MKTAIIISWGDLEDLMRQFCAEKHSDPYKRTLEELRLSELLIWIRNKQKEQSNGQTSIAAVSGGSQVNRQS